MEILTLLHTVCFISLHTGLVFKILKMSYSWENLLYNMGSFTPVLHPSSEGLDNSGIFRARNYYLRRLRAQLESPYCCHLGRSIFSWFWFFWFWFFLPEQFLVCVWSHTCTTQWNVTSHNLWVGVGSCDSSRDLSCDSSRDLSCDSSPDASNQTVSDFVLQQVAHV